MCWELDLWFEARYQGGIRAGMPPHGPFLSVLSLGTPTLTGLAQQTTLPLDHPEIRLRTRREEPLREPPGKKSDGQTFLSESVKT